MGGGKRGIRSYVCDAYTKYAEICCIVAWSRGWEDSLLNELLSAFDDPVSRRALRMDHLGIESQDVNSSAWTTLCALFHFAVVMWAVTQRRRSGVSCDLAGYVRARVFSRRDATKSTARDNYGGLRDALRHALVNTRFDSEVECALDLDEMSDETVFAVAYNIYRLLLQADVDGACIDRVRIGMQGWIREDACSTPLQRVLLASPR